MYCVNNPIKIVDSDGQVIHVVVGAVIGGAVNGGLAAIQGASTQEIKAAVAGGAVAGAITAATGGASVLVALGGGMLAGATGSAVEQVLAKGEINTSLLAMDAAAGVLGGAVASGTGSLINKASARAIQQVESKYSSDAVKKAFLDEVKKEFKSAGKVFGPSTKQQVKTVAARRIQVHSEVDKTVIKAGDALIDKMQNALIEEESKQALYHFYDIFDE